MEREYDWLDNGLRESVKIVMFAEERKEGMKNEEEVRKEVVEVYAWKFGERLVGWQAIHFRYPCGFDNGACVALDYCAGAPESSVEILQVVFLLAPLRVISVHVYASLFSPFL